VAVGEASEKGGFVLVEAALGLPLSYVIYFKTLLRRREFLADAKAINVSETSREYVDILLGQSGPPEGGGGFHPSSDERAGAITFDSPVLSTSPFIVTMALFYVVLRTLPLLGDLSPYPTAAERDAFWSTFFVLNIMPLTVMVLEVVKGKKFKYPLGNREYPSQRQDSRLGLSNTRHMGTTKDERNPI
jgi:hypothetical protein